MTDIVRLGAPEETKIVNKKILVMILFFLLVQSQGCDPRCRLCRSNRTIGCPGHIWTEQASEDSGLRMISVEQDRPEGLWVSCVLQKGDVKEKLRRQLFGLFMTWMLCHLRIHSLLWTPERGVWGRDLSGIFSSRPYNMGKTNTWSFISSS